MRLFRPPSNPALLAIIVGVGFCNVDSAQTVTAAPLSLSCPSGYSGTMQVTSDPSGQLVGAQAEGTGIPGIAVSPPSFNTPATLTVDAHAGCSLGPGIYQDAVDLLDPPGTFPAADTVGVTLQVSNTLWVWPQSVSLTGQGCPSSPVQTSTTVYSSAGENFNASSNQSWLTASPPAGQVGAGSSTSLTISANSCGLSPNTYTGTISVTGSTNYNVAVAFTVLQPASPPVLTASPTSLSFQYYEGASAASQMVSVTSTGGSASYTVAPDNASCPWLSTTTPTGPTPSSFNVSVSSSQPPGVYTCPLKVTGQAGSQSPPSDITVTLTVKPSNVLVSPTSLSFSCQQGGSNPQPQSLTLQSDGIALSFTAQPTAGWLTVQPTSGTIQTEQNGGTVLNATVNCSGLTSAGSPYPGKINITAPNSTSGQVAIGVTLTVGTTSISASPNELQFSGSTAPQSVIISSVPSNQPFTVSPTGCSWLTISPMSGTTGTASGTLSVSVNTQNQSTCKVNVSLTGSPSITTSFEVDFTPPTPPSLTVTPAALTFNYQVGGSQPGAQAISVTSNNPTSGLNFTLSTSNCSWLSVPASGVTPDNSLQVSANPGNLTPATYTCTIAVNATNATQQNVTVTLIVNPASSITTSTSSLTFSYQPGSAPPAPQSFSISATGVTSFTTSTKGSCTWLTVPAKGPIPDTITISVNTAGLPQAVATYPCTININNPSVSNPAVVVATLNVNQQPSLSISPASLSLGSYQIGAAASAPTGTLAISTSTAPATPISFTVTTGAGCGWLSVNPASGTLPASLGISINTAGLVAQNYVCSISIAAVGVSNSPQTVVASLTVTQPAGTLQVSRAALPFGTYQIGGTVPGAIPISVTSSNSGSALAFTVTEGSGCSWLALSPTAGTTPATVSASLNTGGLTSNSYSCSVAIAGGSGPALPVSATLTVAAPVFSVSPSSLTFSYQAGGATSLAAQGISVTSSQSFTATPSPAGQWLSVNPTANATVSVSANPANLPVGSYNGAITISSGGATQKVPVTLNVSGPTLAASGLSFPYVTGGTPPQAKALTVDSSNSQPLSFTATSACPWLNALPSSSIQTGSPIQISVNGGVLTQGGYPPGTYPCTLTITSPQASNSPLYVTLTLTVSPSGLTVSPSTVTFNANQGSTTPLIGAVAINSQTPATAFTLAGNCQSASWLTILPTPGTTPANLSLQANPTGLKASPAPCSITVNSSQGPQTINVSLNVSPLPTLIVAPASLAFQFLQGATPVSQQVVSVLASGNATVKCTVSDTTQPWLHASLVNGNVAVLVDDSLTAGFYSGAFTVSCPQTNPGTENVPVSVRVSPPPPEAPILTVAPANLTFSFSGNANGNGASQPLNAANQGGGGPTVTASSSTNSGGSWLSVQPNAPLAVTGASPAVFTVSANPAAAGLTKGTYTGTVMLTSNGSPTLTVPVTITVTPLPVIGLSRTGLNFTAISGGAATTTQTVYVLNSGSDTLAWSAQPQAGCGNWLTFPEGASGTVAAGVAALQVGVDATAVQPQTAGTYYCEVLVSAQDSTNPQTVSNSPQPFIVTLNLLESRSYVSPIVQTGGYVLNGAPGSVVPPVQIAILNPSNQPVSYSSATVTGDGGTWCTVSPDQGPVTDGVQVSLAADYTKLTVGGSPYSCTGQLAFSDGSLQTVNLVAFVTNAGTSSAAAGTSARRGVTRRQAGTERPEAQGCTPQLPVFLNPAAGFNTLAFQPPVEVDFQIQDSCGNPIDTPNVFLFSSYNGGNGDPASAFVGPTETSHGIYRFEWTPTSVPQNISQSAVTLTASYQASASDITPINSALSGTVSLGPNPTRIGSGGVVNAASFTNQIAPGAWASIFGVNLADGNTNASATQVPLSAPLNGATVYVDNTLVPLNYAADGQINAQIPFTLATDSPHRVAVLRDGVWSLPQSITLAEVQPAIFTVSATGSGQGAIFLSDNTTLADSNHPATQGQIVVLYCSGLGQVQTGPPLEAGYPAPSSPLPKISQAGLSITIGSVPVTVIEYAGLSPGDIGVYQLNVTVPPNAPTGDIVPVVVTVGNLQSQAGVTMAVQAAN